MQSSPRTKSFRLPVDLGPLARRASVALTVREGRVVREMEALARCAELGAAQILSTKNDGG